MSGPKVGKTEMYPLSDVLKKHQFPNELANGVSISLLACLGPQGWHGNRPRFEHQVLKHQVLKHQVLKHAVLKHGVPNSLIPQRACEWGFNLVISLSWAEGWIRNRPLSSTRGCFGLQPIRPC